MFRRKLRMWIKGHLQKRSENMSKEIASKSPPRVELITQNFCPENQIVFCTIIHSIKVS